MRSILKNNNFYLPNSIFFKRFTTTFFKTFKRIEVCMKNEMWSVGDMIRCHCNLKSELTYLLKLRGSKLANTYFYPNGHLGYDVDVCYADVGRVKKFLKCAQICEI